MAVGQRGTRLRTLTLSVVRGRGNVDDDAVQAFLDAGFTTRQILEVVLGVAQKVMSNTPTTWRPHPWTRRSARSSGRKLADEQFPPLNARSIAATRDALHAYARVLGGWSEHSRRRRKHWWNVSLRPSPCGLTTGVIYGAVDFELELDFLHGQLRLKTRTATVSEPLVGQPSKDLAVWIIDALVAMGVDTTPAPRSAQVPPDVLE